MGISRIITDCHFTFTALNGVGAISPSIVFPGVSRSTAAHKMKKRGVWYTPPTRTHMHIHIQYVILGLHSQRRKRRPAFPSVIRAPGSRKNTYDRARNGKLPGTNVLTSRRPRGTCVFVFA